MADHLSPKQEITPMTGTEEHPSVTCVIPTHLRDESLLRAVKSALRQTLPPTSIEIADDSGRPLDRESLKVILSIDPRISVHDSSDASKGGASHSRNTGALGSTSDFLAFLDDDDEWNPQFLELSVGAILHTGKPLAVAAGQLVHGNSSRSIPLPVRPGATPHEAAVRNPGFTGSNFVIQRGVFESIGGFDPNMWVFNDIDFFIRYLSEGYEYFAIPDTLVTQFSSGGGHLSSRSARRAEGIRRFIRKHENLLSRAGRRRHLRASHLAEIHPHATSLERVQSYLKVFALSSASDWREALARRIKRDPHY